ncbi:hypothetical protein DL764_004846 [Monosporascus ibericus]|uniref:Uncharacterized protein n=1 Tax=Monosporascus ibericus TaxID=155417 RepID=A0A4Q4TEN6_9PEZI|nr:hypothetical protein DL764_004846 [Monosporascus ibericus]
MKLTRCAAFTADVRAFRKKFTTKTGLPGTSLYDWRSPEHQYGLAEMTEDYLERAGNGPMWWPDDTSAPNHNKLQYSKDQREIKELMLRLFFRLNEQQHRNNKYKNKVKAGSAEPDCRGHSTEEPIDIDALETGPASDTSSKPYPSSGSAGASSRPDNTHQNPAMQDYDSNEHRKTLDDIYNVPDGTGSEQATSRDSTGDLVRNRQAKRPKKPYKTTIQDDSHRETTRQSPDPATKRRSPREKKTYDVEKDRAEHLYVTGRQYEISMSALDDDNWGRPKANQARRDNNNSEIAGDAANPLQVSNPSEPVQSREKSRDSHTSTPIPASPAPNSAGEVSRGDVPTDRPPQPHRSIPKMEFLYRFVTSRKPVFSYKNWKPTRKLEETSLQQFLDELPLEGDVKGLLFIVEGPGLKAEQQILRGEETEFGSMIKQIKKAIRSELGTSRKYYDHPLVIEMEIEPIKGGEVLDVQEEFEEDFTI